MPDGEIITTYRQAKDKKKQIGILADMNAVTKDAMKRKLAELGLIDAQGRPRTVKHKPEPVTMDELRAMELYNAGLDDVSMADKLGVPEEKVVAWRRRMHLTRPRGRAKKPTPPETQTLNERPEPFDLKPPAPPPEPGPPALQEPEVRQ